MRIALAALVVAAAFMACQPCLASQSEGDAEAIVIDVYNPYPLLVMSGVPVPVYLIDKNTPGNWYWGWADAAGDTVTVNVVEGFGTTGQARIQARATFRGQPADSGGRDFLTSLNSVKPGNGLTAAMMETRKEEYSQGCFEAFKRLDDMHKSVDDANASFPAVSVPASQETGMFYNM